MPIPIGDVTTVASTFSDLPGMIPVNKVPMLAGDQGSGGTAGLVPAPSLGAAAAGKFLKADGTWSVPTGAGQGLTSVGLSTNATFLTVGSSPLTSNGTLTLNLTTGLTANQFLATPNGSTGAVGLRSIVAADIPILNQNTSGSAGSVPAAGVSVGTMASGMTFVAPVLGTPASGALTNCTAIPAGQLTGTVPIARDLNGLHNFSNSSLTPGGNAGTYYYIAPSALTMPASYTTAIAAGTSFKWHIVMKKTAAGTAAFNIRLYYGTNGSISDTTLATQSIGTATTAIDDLSLDIVLVFTSATAAYWSIYAQHSAATATGFGVATGSASFSGTLSALTTTTGSLIFGIGYSNTTGTAVITLPFCTAEAYGVN